MIYRDESNRMDVGPELADLWLDTRYWNGNRPLRTSHVAYLVDEMLADTFGSAEVAFVHTPNGIRLVNGQHTLNAIIKSGRVVRCTVTEFFGEVEDDVSLVYSRMDRGIIRRKGDVLHACNMPERLGLPCSWTKVLNRAVVVIMDGFGEKGGVRHARSYDLGMDLMKEWVKETNLLHECAAGSDKHTLATLHRAAVMAAALVTLRFKPKEAATFWKRVAANDGLSAGQPDHKLVWWLAHTPVRAQGNPVQARAVAACWNAWIEGRSLDKLYADKTRPIRFVGTPYTGKEVIAHGSRLWRAAYPDA